jgi:hypothetical protein
MVWGDLASALRRTRQVALLVGVVWALGVVSGCGGGSPRAASGQACGDAILSDWGANGQVDGEYDADCYLLAIDSLPEDVRSYTSAADDIVRALHSTRPEPSANDAARSVAAAGPRGAFSRALTSVPAETPAPATSASLRRPPTPIVLLGALGLAVAAGIVAPVAARRARRSS